MSEIDKNEQYKIGNFSHLVAHHETGALNETLSVKLRALIEELNDAALDRGGKPSGEIGVVFKITHEKRMLITEARIVEKMPPEPARDRTVYYSTVDGNLSVRDPAQLNLDLRDAKPDPAPARSIMA